jgi:transcription termination/antitermination protein NusA
MTNELAALFDYYEKEKGINRHTMVEALQTAVLAASKKSIGPARELRIEIDPDKGKIDAVASLIVVEQVTHPYDEIALATAQRIKPDIQVGDEIDVKITPKDMGRIAAQTAKHTMLQQLRIAEKANLYEEFKDRAGDVVRGTVRRFDKMDVLIDLGKFEGLMPARERVQTEDYNVGDQLRAYVVAVENGMRGPEIILSRSHPNFVRRLFEFEVSEIADHTVEIKSIAREAGYRTKIAVWSSDKNVDPVGACVGLRGARVKNVVRELNNEKVDIIKWSEDPEEFVRDALRPIMVRSLQIDRDQRQMRVTVDEEELSKAIGRRGLNSRLTGRLMGWDVKIDRDESAHEAFEAKVMEAAKVLAGQLDIPEEQAFDLVQGGVANLETLVFMDAEDVSGILGIEEADAEPILAKARGAFESPAASAEASQPPQDTQQEEAQEASSNQQDVAASTVEAE